MNHSLLGRYRCFAPWEEIPRLMQLLLSFVNSDEVARPPRPAAQAKQRSSAILQQLKR